MLGSAVGATADSKDPAARRREVRAKKAHLASRLDVLKASDAEIQRALDAIEANVVAQQARVDAARQAATVADRTLAESQAAEQAKEAELASLEQRVRQLAVDAYVNPSTGDLAATLSAKSITEMTRKRELLEFRMSRSGDLVDRLRAAREDLGVRRQAAEQARDRAKARKASVESQLGTFQKSLRQQQAFADQVETRIDQALAEADALSRVDQQLSNEIARRNALIAARNRVSRSAPGVGGGGVTGPARRVGSISVTSVRGIVVATSIADNLESLLSAAEADGFTFSGGGYRDSSAQIATRRANCGTSDYAIYEMPPSQCSPPTARPGSSMHEQGLAIDFTWQGRIIGSRSSPAFQWLARNAGRFGLYNLPSEPWHWSTNGN